MTNVQLASRQDLRARLRAERGAYVRALDGAARRDLETRLAENLVPHLGPPAILGVHAPVGMEIGIRPTIARALELGWEIAWPRVQDGGPLCFHLAEEGALASTYRGIPEPMATAPRARPDVLLVPLVAIDRHGNRLGQGGGHYDRTLAVLRSHGPIMSIGLCWDVQLVDSLPNAAWDQPLDAIATPSGFFAISHRDR